MYSKALTAAERAHVEQRLGESGVWRAAMQEAERRMALLRAEAQHAGAPDAFLAAAAAAFNAARDALPPAQARALLVAGPMPAPMPRRAGMHRAQLLLSSPARPALHAVLGAVVDGLHGLPEARRVRWSLDVDPVDLY